MQRYKKLSIINYQLSIELLSHLGFFVVIGLSVWFYHLRNAFGESAMILFNLINEPDLFAKSTWFSIHWFQNVMTILAVKSNLSFSLVNVVFSASPMIFVYGIFLMTRYVFKQKNAGIFLLLLFLGVNQTFFGAVHSPLVLASMFYLVLVIFRTIFGKYQHHFSQFTEVGIWAFLCLFLFVRVSPSTYSDVVEGSYYFSFIGYFSSVAIGAFVISFIMAAYLGLAWIYKKQFKQLILLIVWTVLMLSLIFIFGRNGLLSVGFELLFFPLIAGLVGFFAIDFRIENEPSSTRFWMVWTLVILAVFGQIRTYQDFEKRHNFVVKLLQHTPKTGDKFALYEKTQQLERYIDPTYLAFETPLIAKLHGLPKQTVYFVPTDTTKNIPKITTAHSPYFQFSDQNYIICDTSFIKRTLYKIMSDTVDIFSGDTVQYAATKSLFLQRGDSISLSVLRKGSDNGLLLLTDHLPQHIKFWMREQFVSEPDTEGWQKLFSTMIISETERYKTYLWNKNHKKEQIYFKDFRVEIWRE
jgi:hypothetical protein